ncbi:hypothetical protein GCM10009668_18690 [Nocardioides dubius]|uniref:DUF222 domain-containing protein n=1 Tax=Nocardioides dubius TaxID=317019 RepID=A0ABP4EGA4_9ACTN
MPRITPPTDPPTATVAQDALALSQQAICQATLAIEAALDLCSDAEPIYLTTAEKQAVLLKMPVLQARLTELNYRLLACAFDVADAHGARNIGDYLAHETHQAHGTMARELRTARDLDSRWMHLHAALRDGRVNLAQSVEITRSLNALPDDLDTTVLRDAERTLVEHAKQFGPNDLRRMGKRIIDVVAPEIAEAVEGKRLADEERSARERQQLTLKPQGDGTTRISGLLTDGCANRLATALNAITNPRRDHLTPAPCGCAPDTDGTYRESCGDLECPGHDPHHGTFADAPGGRRDDTTGTERSSTSTGHASNPRTCCDGTAAVGGSYGSGGTAAAGGSDGSGGGTKPNPVRKLSTPQRNARALNTLLETLDPKRLPLHGGDATTVVVTISLDALRNEIGTATLTTQRNAWHDRISAGEARRLACNAGIIPAVLDGQSQPLDLGRTKRFYSAAQHRALALMHPYCRAENCRIPATWCEAHHNNPWSLGGRTDLTDGSLLCSKHHHYIHDPTYTVEHLPHGGIRFTRRT